MPEIEFYDSVTPAKIPAGATHAALYRDGKFAATPEQAKRFPHVVWITVDGDPHSQVADFEPGNPVFAADALSRWEHQRHTLGRRGIIYCDRSSVAGALAELSGRRADWWISTLDGKRWTAEELAADLKASFGVTIPAGDIWANQYAGGPDADYDTSDLFGVW